MDDLNIKFLKFSGVLDDAEMEFQTLQYSNTVLRPCCSTYLNKQESIKLINHILAVHKIDVGELSVN